MGRRETELLPDGTAAKDLAIRLRALRREHRLTYQQLSTLTNYSVSALQAACSGRGLPTWQITKSIVEACGDDPSSWEQFWIQARSESPPTTPTEPLPTEPSSPGTEPAAEQVTFDAMPVEADTAAGETAGEASHTEVGLAMESTPPRSLARRMWWVAAAVITIVAVVAGTVLLWPAAEQTAATTSDALTDSSMRSAQIADDSSTLPDWTRQQGYNRNGSPTFRDPSGVADPGEKVAFEQFVTVSCKVFAPSIPSVYPDGYWYRLADPPWNDLYYAAANTFLNGDNPAGPYTHSTDFAVPDC